MAAGTVDIRGMMKSSLLHQTVFAVDRALDRHVVRALPLEGLRLALDDMDRFRLQADRRQLEGQDHKLVAAGCRLSNDLNEAVIERLVDAVQHQDAAIAQLSRQLAQRLKDRDQALRLLNKAQRLKQQMMTTANEAGLP